MSTIAAGTTSGTALVNTGDTTGQLILQTNGTTTAVTIGTNQVVTLAQPLPAGSGGTGNAFFSVSGPATSTKTYTFPNENMSVGYLDIPQNVQTGSYTLVIADAGKHIYRASGGAATWTIPAASSVAYPIGTALTFINLSATSVSIAITTDTMYLSSAGTTGTRTLAQYGSATAVKLSGLSSSGVWIISGSGLT